MEVESLDPKVQFLLKLRSMIEYFGNAPRNPSDRLKASRRLFHNSTMFTSLDFLHVHRYLADPES